MILLLTGAGIFTLCKYNTIKNKPEALFEQAKVSSEQPRDEQRGADETAEAVSSDSDSKEEPAVEIKDGIVNILLLGIDAREDGSTTSGTMPHTDAVMVVAVNFNENTVDLISIPRDALTVALPPYRGYYKLNGTFNVGGGMDDPEAGCDYVRREAEQWLGGISIPYYYGLDFQAVVDIVDAIGGIDYDVDLQYPTIDGKKIIYPGVQHLDGNEVMGYIRIRKGYGADGRDSARTNRQRRMVSALFAKLKSETKLRQIPALIHSAKSGIYTNTTLAQTAALADYALDLPPENLRQREFYGEYTINYTWAYNFIDQEKRIAVIEDVYGFTPEKIGTDTRRYEEFLVTYGAENLKYLAQGEKVLSSAEESCENYAACKDACAELRKIHENMESWVIGSCSNRFCSYSEEDREAYKAARAGLGEARKAVYNSVTALAEESGYEGTLKWEPHNYWNDRDINTVYVDFA